MGDTYQMVVVDSVGCAKPLGIMDMLTQMDKELARVSAAIVDLEAALEPLITTPENEVEPAVDVTAERGRVFLCGNRGGKTTAQILTELGYQTRRISEFADQIVAMRSRLLL